MRFGICKGLENLKEVTDAGANFIECNFSSLMQLTDEELNEFSKTLSASPIKCEAMNVLFPGSQIPLTGSAFNPNEVKNYLSASFNRISRYFSPDIIAFGSGGARKCPEGFDRGRAKEQLIETGRIAAEAAAAYNITIALEPLNIKETNMVNSLTEGMEIVKAVDRENFKLLADIYHMLSDNEPPEAILPCKGYIAHTHIATKSGRLYPQKTNADEFLPYFNVLKEIGYNRRMSIEGGESGALKDSLTFLSEEWAI